jgi:hypothetical protein
VAKKRERIDELIDTPVWLRPGEAEGGAIRAKLFILSDGSRIASQ